MVNYRLKSHILEVVETQLKMNDPKCTRNTLNRLMDLGFSKEESIEQIGAVLVEEMYDIMKNQVPFNEKRYSKKLAKLPENREETEHSDENEIIQSPLKREPKIGRNEICPCGSHEKYKKCCGKL